MTGCGAGAAGTAPAPVTYEFYRDAYGGDLGPEELSAALVAAERHVQWLVGGREPACETDALAYRRAVCAAADAFAEWNEEGSGVWIAGIDTDAPVFRVRDASGRFVWAFTALLTVAREI